MKGTFLTSLLIGAAAAAPKAAIFRRQTPDTCAADTCVRAVTGRPLILGKDPAPSAKKVDCSSFFSYTVTPATSTITTTITPAAVLTTETTTAATVVFTSSTTSTLLDVNIVNLKRQVAPAASTGSPTAIPTYVGLCSGAARYSSACSCFGVIPQYTTVPTPTTTVTVTAVASTLTATESVTASTTTTSIKTVINATPTDCVPGPQETRSYFRIEGATDTIFEGYACAGPANITTPSGGTHLCDGTNNNANPAPGGTLITLINSAGSKYGFDFDGTWNSYFQDFYISRIGTSFETGGQTWGFLINEAFTPRGGCESEYTPTDRTLWAFGAYNADAFLILAVSSNTVLAGGSIQATVQGVDGDGGSVGAQSGALVGGQTTDANGLATITFPTAGFYRLKATKSRTIRSNAQYITVL